LRHTGAHILKLNINRVAGTYVKRKDRKGSAEIAGLEIDGLDNDGRMLPSLRMEQHWCVSSGSLLTSNIATPKEFI